MTNPITDAAMDVIFRTARTFNHWQNKPVDASTLRAIYDLCKWGPTAANSSPMRIVFVQSADAKAKLKPCLAPGNADKTMAAPVTAIIAHDIKFYDQLPKLMPHVDARSWYAGNDPLIAETAFRNSSLQGAYFMIAARAVGLDCGPMSGFDAAKLDSVFFPDSGWKSNFICNLGYGDSTKMHPRGPRLDFDQVCKIL